MFDGQIGDLWRQAQKMGERLKTQQAALAAKRIDVNVGGGSVRLQVDGQGKALNLAIDDELLHPKNQALLQHLLLSAMNESRRRCQELARSEFGSWAEVFNTLSPPQS